MCNIYSFPFSFQQLLNITKKRWYITDYRKINFIFLICFHTFICLMGSHITWMPFALHAPYSKFCKDGMMMVNWPKHVVKLKWNRIYCCVWLESEPILSPFSLLVLLDAMRFSRIRVWSIGELLFQFRLQIPITTGVRLHNEFDTLLSLIKKVELWCHVTATLL